MISVLRAAALLFAASTATATAQAVAAIATDGIAIDVPVPATALLFGTAFGAAMLLKAYRKRR